MKLLFFRRDRTWRDECGKLILPGHRRQLTPGWEFVLHPHNNSMRFRVHVYRGATEEYMYILPKLTNVFLFPEGLVELTKVDPIHRRLAIQVVGMLPRNRRGDRALCVVRVLRGNQRVANQDFRSKKPEATVFTDGYFRCVRQTPSTPIWRCAGATHLVRISRHNSGDLCRVEITVDPDYDLNKLGQTLQGLVP